MTLAAQGTVASATPSHPSTPRAAQSGPLQARAQRTHSTRSPSTSISSGSSSSSSPLSLSSRSPLPTSKPAMPPTTTSGLAPSHAAPAGAELATKAAPPISLTEQQTKDFAEQGFLVLPGFASREECAQLQSRMGELVEGFDPSSISVFSTRNQTKNTNQYFLESGGNISFFFEENAFEESGALKQPKALSINKVGHALHDLDPVFRGFSRSPKMAALLHSLGFRTALPVQSMYIFKQPGIGGEVVPHQDSTFLYTDPPSCVGLWLAVEDATEENGCLWVLPASHKGELARRFMRTAEGGVTFDKSEVPSYDTAQFVPVPVPAGSLVVLHGGLVHFSYENKSPVSRHAYSVHIIEGEGCNYPADNWLQRGPKDTPFEPLKVA